MKQFKVSYKIIAVVIIAVISMVAVIVSFQVHNSKEEDKSSFVDSNGKRYVNMSEHIKDIKGTTNNNSDLNGIEFFIKGIFFMCIDKSGNYCVLNGKMYNTESEVKFEDNNNTCFISEHFINLLGIDVSLNKNKVLLKIKPEVQKILDKNNSTTVAQLTTDLLPQVSISQNTQDALNIQDTQENTLGNTENSSTDNSTTGNKQEFSSAYKKDTISYILDKARYEIENKYKDKDLRIYNVNDSISNVFDVNMEYDYWIWYEEYLQGSKYYSADTLTGQQWADSSLPYKNIQFFIDSVNNPKLNDAEKEYANVVYTAICVWDHDALDDLYITLKELSDKYNRGDIDVTNGMASDEIFASCEKSYNDYFDGKHKTLEALKNNVPNWIKVDDKLYYELDQMINKRKVKAIVKQKLNEYFSKQIVSFNVSKNANESKYDLFVNNAIDRYNLSSNYNDIESDADKLVKEYKLDLLAKKLIKNTKDELGTKSEDYTLNDIFKSIGKDIGNKPVSTVKSIYDVVTSISTSAKYKDDTSISATDKRLDSLQTLSGVAGFGYGTFATVYTHIIWDMSLKKVVTELDRH